MMHANIIGFWLIVISTILLTFKGIFAGLAYQAGASVDATLLIRFVICLPFLWGFFYYRKNNLRQYLNRHHILLFMFLGFTGFYLAAKADYTAIQMIGAGLSRMILYIYPILVITLNAIITRTLPSRAQIVLAIVIQIGLFMAISGGNLEILEVNLIGSLISLSAAVFWSIHLVTLTHYTKHINSLSLISIMVSFATFLLTIEFFVRNPVSDLVLSFEAYFWITMMAIFSSAIPFIIFTEGVKRIGSNYSSLIGSFGPILALLLSWMILGEIFNLIQIVGSILIVICIYILGKRIGKAQTQPLD